MLVLTSRPKFVSPRQETRPDPIPAKPPHLRAELRTIAVGLGTVQLLLDTDQVGTAKEMLRTIRDELQTLRRSS